MLFTTLGQHRVFLWMLAAGALTGAWYAGMAALRRLLSAGPWLSLLADCAFGLGAAAIFCLALFTANYGQLRLYAVLADALGFGLFALGALHPAAASPGSLFQNSFILASHCVEFVGLISYFVDRKCARHVEFHP